ncbi:MULTISPECIES: FAD-binding oxidoreductase [unclassified Lysobacter]|uniref:FAD-binding oxidoreductase n=1 Tax=unclassified Lysobacter TaxID=2635362 RepID=UPI001BEAD086|nr:MULTISPECIES: FAD-binding oxidoreductase [unclassified Lysobacter]MBT2748969.1 FAD-binding oxidoreductase [Lysobacter sp. ISL-42]MBT2751294.1 FAD-binding oxidoreductase [Lysobacter sp. ISL-50]MBT2776498.1 FAD-binding oxidoreductase [Lysobacter sp. ISL-54]MBT2780993.1 FAD-binding oxidoreductase [Lysobacter sp. ISL-52]
MDADSRRTLERSHASCADPDRRKVLQALAASAALAAAGCARESPDRDERRLHDISGIDETNVARVLKPASVAAVAAALRASRGVVSIGGARCSMGGQIACENSLHLDMRGLNRPVALDLARRRVRVQTGMRWRDLQELIDPHGLAVSIMQSYSSFSIGGSLSVNCHGRYVGKGSLIHSLRALQLVDADGQMHELDREHRPDLFRAAVGGYGGLGVITEAEFDLAANHRIARRAERVALDEYPAWFAERVLADPASVLHNADLLPPRFDAPVAVTWTRCEEPLTLSERLVPRDGDYRHDRKMIWSVSELPGGSWLRKRYSIQEMLREREVVWRNHEASLDIASLEPRTRRYSTYLLQEYFVPVPAFAAFARAMTRVLRDNEVHALNISIRHAPADRQSLLSWSPTQVFSFVLYHKQRSGEREDAVAGQWTRRLIDIALDHGGRHYLPYRLHGTREQFLRGYRAAPEFAALKQAVDPRGRFRNRMWDKYLPG